jgi:predicted permease
MQTQNYSNHSRYVPLYHYVASALLLAVLIGSFINLSHAVDKGEAVYSASLICVLCVILVLVWWFSRSFALKAQDRAIRAEENFRHFILTGKPFDNRLSMPQIIALRFAGDEELAMLAQKAVAENLSSKQIKQSIQHWRGDYNRA